MTPYDTLMSTADRMACCEMQAASAAPEPAVAVAAAPCMAMPSLAMVYAKLQPFAATYSPDEALARGTLFADLDLPFTAGGQK